MSAHKPISELVLLMSLLALPALALAESQNISTAKQMMAQKNYDEALKYFSAAGKAEPTNAEAFKGVGYVYIYKGDKAKALPYLKYALQLNPADTQLKTYVDQLSGTASPAPAAGGATQMIQYGNYYIQQKQYDNAIGWFNKATQAEPNNAKAWKGLGYAYAYKSDKTNAITALERSVALDASDTGAAGYLAQLKGSSPVATASAAPAASAQAGEPEAAKSGVNPWVMGSTVAILGAVMLLLF